MSRARATTVGMRPPHPGTFVRDEILVPLDLSVTRASAILGVRRATLSDLVNAKVGISSEMALRIEKAFGVDMEVLLRLQAWHDTLAQRKRADEIKVKPYRRALAPAAP